MSTNQPNKQAYFELFDFQLESGVKADLRLAYRSYGELNARGDNVIVLPTYYTGTDLSYLPIISSDHSLNPEKYFIVVPNLFGNGVSSSPSNMPAPYDAARFPKITMYDNIRAQAMLLDSLGVDDIALVLGWSMGGVQSYQWAAQYPERVKRALVICGAAKTAEHNIVFLKGVKAALEADAHFADGDYQNPPEKGLRAFGRIYAGWAFSQAFYRNQRFKEMGFATAEDLLMDWEEDHLTWDANDLLAMLDTWITADISRQAHYDGDLVKALGAIKAKTWLVPCEQDLYFRYEDNLAELEHLQDGEYHGFESDFGHVAPGPGRFSEETAIVENIIHKMLNADV